MTRDEVLKNIDDIIEYHINECNLEKEEVTDDIILNNFVAWYVCGEISKDDLIMAINIIDEMR